MEFNTVFWRTQKIGEETFANKTIFANRFRIDRLVGEGGFGAVYIAQDLLLKTKVALKVSRIGLKREALVLRNLPRDRFVSIFDFVKDSESESYGYAMELLNEPWRTFDDYFENKLPPKPKNRKYSIERVKRILLAIHDVLVGLNHLHGAKKSKTSRWCHGDIKPNNLYLDEAQLKTITKATQKNMWVPFTKIGDLGLAQKSGDHIPHCAPAFASPEQIQGQSIHPKSDIFALGKSLAYLITNEFWENEEISRRKQIEEKLGENVPSWYLTKKIGSLLKEMTASTLWRRPEGQEIKGVISDLLSDDPTWDVLRGFASHNGLLLNETPGVLFPYFAERLSWERRSQERDEVIVNFVREATKKRVLFTNGKRYYSFWA